MSKKKYPVWITTHTGKLEGMHSINTSALCNPYCIARAKNPDCICSKCYANNLLKARTTTNMHAVENTGILTTRIINPETDLPIINDCYFRFESFGDLINDTQLINYVLIARHYPDTKFALWTKNAFILKQVFCDMKMRKPRNLSIVLSSENLNEPRTVPECLKPYIDHVFTVYDKKHSEEVNIQCGKSKCLKCKLCYKRNTDFYINELLKGVKNHD